MVEGDVEAVWDADDVADGDGNVDRDTTADADGVPEPELTTVEEREAGGDTDDVVQGDAAAEVEGVELARDDVETADESELVDDAVAVTSGVTLGVAEGEVDTGGERDELDDSDAVTLALGGLEPDRDAVAEWQSLGARDSDCVSDGD